MAEKNIAALVREDTRTIGVRFYKEFEGATKWDPNDDSINADMSPKEYTYVTNLDFRIGDLAVVRVSDHVKVAMVTRVDEGCDIEPNGTVKFSWVIDKVDQVEYEKQLDINKQLEDTVNKAYKQSVKSQFRNLVLGSIDSEAALKINMLLGVTPK